MIYPFKHHRRLALAFVHVYKRHYISGFSHLTSAEIDLYHKHMEAKSRLPPKSIEQKPSVPQHLQPRIYHPECSDWVVRKSGQGHDVKRGSVLKVASWNIDMHSPGVPDRTFAALKHLKAIFGKMPGALVVMLQEVRHESLQVILENLWVQQNFVLTNVDSPESLYTETPVESFSLKDVYWKASHYFTVILVPRQMEITSCFRYPFQTAQGRDALLVDIPISASDEQNRPKDSLRLCTTHLESLWNGRAYRLGQLARISSLLKGQTAAESKVIAGLVGGDMNAIDQTEHELHKSNDVHLNDVWEDVQAPTVPVLKAFQKDFSYGQARGNTWGYQSNNKTRKRMDKFFYTGSIETVPLTECQDVTGRLGRFGIGVRTEVERWVSETTQQVILRGKVVQKPHRTYFSSHVVESLRKEELLHRSLVRERVNAWVSDHYGIAVGIRIV